MEFRIGVHLGEVCVEGDRLYGDGVNIAARLEGLAEPGGTCISGTVFEQIRRKLELDFDDLGEQAVKNIPDPVHAYLLRERAAQAPEKRTRGARWTVVVAAAVLVAVVATAYVMMRSGTPTPTGPPLTSIAVLPFDDMSPGGDHKWLADGMAEELIDMLSRIEQLRVIARTSAFMHKGEDIATIGERLQVGSVVEGSVRRSRDQLRVTAQLIRVADRSHLWSRTYQRQLEDVFAIQRELAQAVAEAIRAEFGVSETVSWMIESRYSTDDVRAWELVKRGVDRWQTYTEEGFRDDIRLASQALEIEPEYAEAYAQQGWGNYALWYFGIDPRAEIRSRARAAAERALESDPTNASAHNLLGWLTTLEGDLAGAEARYRRAMRAAPSHGPLRDGYGMVLLAADRVDEAAPHIERAVSLDPELPPFRMSLGMLYIVRGDLNAAIREFERGLPGWSYAPVVLATAHHLNGDRDAATEVLIQAEAPSPATADGWRQALDEDGIAGVFQAVLDYRISRSGSACTADPDQAALLLAVIGGSDRMFDCLDQAIRVQRAPYIVKVWPAFDPYRSDPRFIALLRRMGLEE
jgi:TolB-like protein